jgi:hypothetical protein
LGDAVYVRDVRGYGRSTRPPEISQPQAAHGPLVRSTEALHDIDAVVNWILDYLEVDRVAVLGWAPGGHWAGYYATSTGTRSITSIIHKCNTALSPLCSWDSSIPVDANADGGPSVAEAASERQLARHGQFAMRRSRRIIRCRNRRRLGIRTNSGLGCFQQQKPRPRREGPTLLWNQQVAISYLKGHVGRH